jgi:hypothetical protein
MGRMSSMCCIITFMALLLFILIVILVSLFMICYANDDSKMDRCNSPGLLGIMIVFIGSFCNFNNFN